MNTENYDPLLDLLYAANNYIQAPTDENRKLFNQLFSFNRNLANLPTPTYKRIVGFNNQIQKLQQLVTTTSSKMIAIQGDSGFGKTALADNVVRHIPIQNFEELPKIRWITIKPRGSAVASRAIDAASNIIETQFYREIGKQLGIETIADIPSLQIEQILENTASNPSIFVIDNLQNPADVESLRELSLPLLERLRILYTSPTNAPTVANDSEQQHIIEPLDKDSTIELTYTEGGSFVSTIPDNELSDIYRLLGGYPLAIKLTAKQIEKLQSLDRVLKNLSVQENASPEQISSQVHEVVWEHLSEDERNVLETIAMYGVAGVHYSTLQFVLDDLPESMLNNALENLLNISAIYSDQEQDTIRYYTHELTSIYVDQL